MDDDLNFDDLVPPEPPAAAPAGGNAGLSFDDLVPKAPASSIPKAISGMPEEAWRTTKDTAQNAWGNLKESFARREPPAGEGFWEGYAHDVAAAPGKFGKFAAGLGQAASLPLAPVIGAGKSLIGRPMADVIHKAGEYINPEVAAKQTPEGIYQDIREDVGTALSAVAPWRGRAPVPPSRVVQSPGVPRAETSAGSDLARALERDNDTPADIMARLQEARTVRPAATLADVGGENVRGLVERVAQTPGAGRTTVVPALTTKQQGQMTRLSNDLTALTGTRRTAQQATAETMAQRQADAAPLYDIAMDFNARTVPEIVDAWQRETAQGWGRQVLSSPEFKHNLETEYGITDAANAPLMKVIDAWKKSVDDLVSGARQSGSNNRARILSDMLDRLVSVVDEHNPAYPEARNSWAGHSQYLDAIEEGRNILSNKVSAEELATEFGRRTDAQKEAYRIGAVAAVRAKMGNDPAKMADMTKYLRSHEMRAKLAAIMPDNDAAQSFMQRLNYEVTSSEMTGRALGNSATARRLAEKEDAESLMGDLVMGAIEHKSGYSLARQAIMALPLRIRDYLRSRRDAVLGELLTTPQGDARLQSVLAAKSRKLLSGPLGRSPSKIGASNASGLIEHAPQLPGVQVPGSARSEEERRNQPDVPRPPAQQKNGGRVRQENSFANGGRIDPDNIHSSPTEAQKKAGNYAKDHVRIHGLDITIENAKGSKRSGTDKGGKTWSVTMPAHYGYIKGTVGRDKDHVDVYLGPHIRSPKVFVVDQVDAETKKADEHKCFLGFSSKQQVVRTYVKAFSDGKGTDRLGAIHEINVDAFKHWLEHGDTTKPMSKAA